MVCLWHVVIALDVIDNCAESKGLGCIEVGIERARVAEVHKVGRGQK